MDQVEGVSETAIHILPYSRIVGQEQLKFTLELGYLVPRLAGVLVAGQRGTAKSTAVRAFARMAYGKLPVTLPINATEDRVIGGWEIDALMRGEAKPQAGLLKEANGGLLYVDEINLLDDHIVNLILDVTSTGVLSRQREGLSGEEQVAFTLVGTMNPEEGSLRPQLLDRFGLMVAVTSEKDALLRGQILLTMMEFDQALQNARNGRSSRFLEEGKQQDLVLRRRLLNARNRVAAVKVPSAVVKACIDLSAEFEVEGHRGEYVTAIAAQACAALEGAERVEFRHVRQVAPLALSHRRRDFLQGGQWFWTEKEDGRIDKCLPQ
jgi:magnesium chelatase subunit I